MRITVKTADVLKKLEAKKKTLDGRRQVILNELKKKQGSANKFRIKALKEVLASVQVELTALQAGKPTPQAKSIIEFDYGDTKRNGKKYQSRVKVYNVQKIDDVCPDRWGITHEKDRINEKLRRLDEMLGAVRMSSSSEMEVDSERGEYFDILKF
jgi:hypothetical protein